VGDDACGDPHPNESKGSVPLYGMGDEALGDLHLVAMFDRLWDQLEGDEAPWDPHPSAQREYFRERAPELVRSSAHPPRPTPLQGGDQRGRDRAGA